jgi:3-(3-hydroxy-phenyl)propionate hydroxylase
VTEQRVIIAGAGPVGLSAAAALVMRGVPVLVLEEGDDLSTESRASTFHPSTLDMLADFGVADDLIDEGLVAPELQFRTPEDGVIAQFDFADIADLTAHPFRLQAEQYRLTRLLHARLTGEPGYDILFGHQVVDVRQDDEGVSVGCQHMGQDVNHRGAWLIGADGAGSLVREAVGIAFDGFTWPERFLVLGTTFDFHARLDGLVSVNYVSDPVRWHFLLRTPAFWRVMFPVDEEMSDEVALGTAHARAMLSYIVAGAGETDIRHATIYRVHQRVAESFRSGRVFLAGDAAHINNPLGGMGMNGGIHDAVNLAERLAAVWHGQRDAADLEHYDAQRRGITLEYVQAQTIQNKKDLEATEPAARAEFCNRISATAADPAKAREYLLRASMIASLKRAAELG